MERRFPSPAMRRVALVAVLLVVAVAPIAAHTNHVSADAQVTADRAVVAEAVFLADDGWLVLHADDGGEPGEPIGHRYVEDGEFRTDVAVNVTGSAWRDWSGAREVWVVAHHDDGDGEWEPGEDEMLTSFGSLVGTEVTVERGDAEAYVTAEEFGPHTTDDRRVRVRSVALPADGYLVLRNGSADGRVVGHAALSAGVHGNVPVALSESFSREAPDAFELFASVAVDDGDGTFDAEDDEAVTAGEATVGTTFGVKKEGSAVGTASPTPTPTEAETVTPTGTATATPSDSPTTAAGETGGDGAGFGAVAALVAVVALLAALRRR